MLKKNLFILVAVIGFGFSANAQIKTIHVTPSTAKIFLNSSEVGNGTYTYKFSKKTDFIMLKFEAEGYLTKEVRLFRDNPNKDVAYTLAEDEAEKNSVGGENSVTVEKWFDITVKQGMTEDDAWKRIMSVVTNNFNDIEIRDKSAGWIKTAWSMQTFTYQFVRTRLEVKIAFGDENELKYRVRISSQIANRDCGRSDQCFVNYNRVLNKFATIIQELQNVVGSNR
ncbi:MAG: hypothetical protein LBN95_10270 [Prevotellaceae bacterium]|jgi:hypothetical protein|nr:hypothetical protein [Prevotellaceae bacterium]